MRTLYLRIYLTVVAVLLVFALVSGWIWHARVENARVEGREVWRDRVGTFTDLAEASLPDASAPPDEQRAALQALAERLRLPLALDARDGERIAASESFLRRDGGPPGRKRGPGAAGREDPGAGSDAGPERDGPTGPEGPGLDGRRSGPGVHPMRPVAVPLDDGRTLWVLRPGGMLRPPPPMAPGWFGPPSGAGIAVALVVLFGAIALGAYPVVRRLTRRLEALKQGVEAFGAGALNRRVDEDGRDEVAAVASSFNRAAERIQTLVASHRTLLANASHELRSPLARLKMALALHDGAAPAERDRLRREIDANIAELDALVEEVLLASRLDAAAPDAGVRTRVDLLGLAAEEAARVDAELAGASPVAVDGDERLLRRALRNLLENARRHGGGQAEVSVEARDGSAVVRVCDRGPGVPEALRERIFEAFYRLPGQAEQAGGVGLGLSLVRQIAERHGGSVRCLARDGGGSCFELVLPAAML
ncbi:MAG: HAMP domain-containing protein [Piscinibacter sp.]|nr:HAMP domain-containing protein [Piscinibacter sp.]